MISLQYVKDIYTFAFRIYYVISFFISFICHFYFYKTITSVHGKRHLTDIIINAFTEIDCICKNSPNKEHDLIWTECISISHVTTVSSLIIRTKLQCIHSTGKMIAFRVFNLLLDDLINADFDEIHLYSKFDSFIGDTDP